MKNPTLSTLKVVQQVAFIELIKDYASQVYSKSISISKEDLVAKTNKVIDLSLIQGLTTNATFDIVEQHIDKLMKRSEMNDDLLARKTISHMETICGRLSSQEDANQFLALINKRKESESELTAFVEDLKKNNSISSALESFTEIVNSVSE